ncbi:MAG: hypothetical protein EKK48_19375 [Candidatus Melainabacteria bacterium]|nr:MAG: hypothetical protein EKK48_19375 [Candidatus Melainabacteria bacterium]
MPMDRRSLTNLLLPVLLLMSSGVAASECDARNPIRNPILRTFNVRTYGAKGDGKTNDTAAIKAAITAAGIGTGNTVLFPEGDYLYDQELTVNGIFLRGESGARLRLPL